MRKKEKVLLLKQILDKEYKDAKCSLLSDTVMQLLVAVMLSAQCTDARVNIVTRELFLKYKTPKDFANANLDVLMEEIKPCGFYKNKAKNIISCAKNIVDNFNSIVPDNMDDLLSLSGVGRKTANLILGDVYNKPALVIDTHAIRLTNRIGLTKEKDPQKIEFELMKIIPDDYQIHFCHQMVYHGRAICNARKPKCDICPICHLCKYFEKENKKCQN